MLNLLYGCDDNYAPYAGISITSLFESNQALPEITVYLAAMSFSSENIKKFRTLAANYNRKIVFLDTKKAEAQINSYRCKGWNGSLATWLRFFVFDQIPESVDRLLWLDSDTIIQESLEPLTTLDLSNYPIACVCDSICLRQRYRLGLTEQEAYYNAGVILFNLTVWRKNKVLPKMMSHLAEHVSYYQANDQDLLNDFFRENILRLPIKYNFQGIHLAYTPDDYFSCYHWDGNSYYSSSEVTAGYAHPVVIHFFRFLGDYPWEMGENYHPAKQLFEEWRNRSLWSDHKGAPCRRDTRFLVEKWLYRFLPKRLFLKVFFLITNWNQPKHPLADHSNGVQGYETTSL